MSSLSVLQMAIEAGPIIHQRYDGVDLCEYLSMLANSKFYFGGSDGAQLQIHHMLPVDWKPASGPLSVSFDPAPYTIIGTHLTIRGRPVYKLSDGSIVLVFDPVTTDMNCELTDHSFADPQYEITGENRFLRLAINDQDFASHGASLSLIRDKGVKRPANAFILFRTENVNAVKAQYPGVGNNDISKILGRMWQGSSDEAKDVYKARARQLAVSHKLVNPNYKYTPRRSHEIMRRACANKGPSTRADLHRAGVVKRAKKRASTHLGALTERFAYQPSASTMGDIIEEAERVLKSFGLIN